MLDGGKVVEMGEIGGEVRWKEDGVWLKPKEETKSRIRVKASRK